MVFRGNPIERFAIIAAFLNPLLEQATLHRVMVGLGTGEAVGVATLTSNGFGRTIFTNGDEAAVRCCAPLHQGVIVDVGVEH